MSDRHAPEYPLVKVAHSAPEWLKNVFGRELLSEAKQKEKPGRGR
jgi:hypothetical protein